MMKYCSGCGLTKSRSEFSKRVASRDGLCSRCKVCLAKYVRGYYQINRTKILEQKREYGRTHKVKIAEWDRSSVGKESHRKNDENQRAKHPERVKAANALNHAVRDGKIERPSICEHCDKKKFVEGHHWSYLEEHWLDVEWLCILCHRKLHAILRGLVDDC